MDPDQQREQTTNEGETGTGDPHSTGEANTGPRMMVTGSLGDSRQGIESRQCRLHRGLVKGKPVLTDSHMVAVGKAGLVI